MTFLRRRRFGSALVVLLAVAGAAAVLSVHVSRPYQGYEARHQFVEIPQGRGVEAIGQRLIESGVVRDRLSFRYAIWRTGAARRLQAGEYRFDRPMTAMEVVRKLVRGDVHLWPLTFREGLTLHEMAALVEEAGFASGDAFLQAARNAALVADFDREASDLEGYLFPDTYALPRGIAAHRLVALMVARFRQAFDDELQQLAAARGLSAREVVTLASLVEKETGHPEERALVSSVFNNRLRIGMRLQCDPTVIYALDRDGRYTGSIRRADLAYDSPYNTYAYAGLPPGPIAAPGKASLQAALRPADADYLYFVSRNDGSHVFSRTLQEHNRAVYEYQIRYFREKRQAEQQ